MKDMQTTAREPAWKGAALVTGGFVVLLWLLEIFDTATGHPLDAYGIQPRSEDGLVGVVLAPTLHFGFDHLVSNTVPVLVLHGTEDHVTKPSGSRLFGEIGGSHDKTLHLYPGYFHDLLNDVGKERVLSDVMSWLDGHLRLRAA